MQSPALCYERRGSLWKSYHTSRLYVRRIGVTDVVRHAVASLAANFNERQQKDDSVFRERGVTLGKKSHSSGTFA